MGLFDKFTRNDANSWEKKGIKLANKWKYKEALKYFDRKLNGEF